LEAEEASPKAHATIEEFQKKLRALLADWADFDIVATHYAYGFDILCTEDKGKPGSNSIFAPSYSNDLSNKFSVKIMNASELAAHCWKTFKFPVRHWR
jgi:hypothetical protein